MHKHNNQHRTKSQAFLAAVPREILIRLAEMLISSVVLSLLIRFIDNSGITLSGDIYFMSQACFFAVFQAIIVINGINSYRRMHRYYSRYYTANFAAYFLYMLISIIFMLFLDFSSYRDVFGVTISMVYNPVISVSRMYNHVIFFHFVSFAAIILAPVIGLLFKRLKGSKRR